VFNAIFAFMVVVVVMTSVVSDTLPGSLIDSIESLNQKQQNNKESRHAPWLTTLWG
jgi:hypothetical protein